MEDPLDLFRRAMLKGYKMEELRQKYECQVTYIKKKFPKESAARILKGLTFHKFVENKLKKEVKKKED
ncbi:MAG: hypothetical protein GOU97_00010 [Nanoarchaeota archaeon]|nr:hypothetical protein [Nanoarchaeota archaeon]